MVRAEVTHRFGVDPARVRVVPNGVDLERFRPAGPEAREGARRALGVATDEALALFVGRPFAPKGLGTLLEAAARPESARPWVVVAGGEASGPWRRLARRLGVRARFLGEVRDLGPLHGAADVLAAPTFYDPCSLATLEALAAGLPVVTTRDNGAGEGLEEAGAGLVLEEAGDAVALARALGALLGPEGRESRRSAARRLAEGRPSAEAFRRVEEVLLDAAGERR
ncbi:MAG: glycosyltransferase family 4 protein [Planctomycetes bacterium]|nr:glycosyltransferase family 4 protein [Planctomycetota bacterium]